MEFTPELKELYETHLREPGEPEFDSLSEKEKKMITDSLEIAGMFNSGKVDQAADLFRGAIINALS